MHYLHPVSTDSSKSEQDTRSPLAKVGIAVAVLAVIVVVGFAVRWWTHPTVFGGLGDSYISQPRPLATAALSTTVIFPKVEGEPEIVTIDSAEAVFSKNTAKATATFSICHLGPEEDPIGAVHDPDEFCRDIVPLEAGAQFRHGVAPDSDYLFVTIEPSSVGVARLARVEIQYKRGARHLYQRGTESIRVARKITIK